MTDNLEISGNIEYNYLLTHADDRQTYNKEEITDAMTMINKLNIKKYDKTKEMIDTNYIGIYQSMNIIKR